MASAGWLRNGHKRLPDHAVNMVEFKREMVRLDYIAERLQVACQQVQNERRKRKEELNRALQDVQLRQSDSQQRRIKDDLDTLQLERRAREVSEQLGVLQSSLLLSKQQLDIMWRKKMKMQQSVNGLEEYRLLLNDIIMHKGSPRTLTGDINPQEIIQNPDMIRIRLSHKERNLISQSQLVFQACGLIREQSKHRFWCNGEAGEGDPPQRPHPTATLAASTSPLFGLSNANFATINRLYQRFISNCNCNCIPQDSFGAIERYAFYLLQLVDACEPAMLRRIIAKVVVDKRKLMKVERMRVQAEHRQRRERIALANATSAPAQFRRPAVTRKRFSVPTTKRNKVATSQSDSSTHEDLSYLFRRQIDL